MEARQEALASQQRLAEMDQELEEVRDRVSRLKDQQNSPSHPTTSHSPICRKSNNSSLYPMVSRILSDRCSMLHMTMGYLSKKLAPKLPQ